MEHALASLRTRVSHAHIHTRTLHKPHTRTLHTHTHTPLSFPHTSFCNRTNSFVIPRATNQPPACYQVEKLKTKPFLKFQRLYLVIYLLAFTGVSVAAGSVVLRGGERMLERVCFSCCFNCASVCTSIDFEAACGTKWQWQCLTRTSPSAPQDWLQGPYVYAL